MSNDLPPIEEECFFITEIGKKDSAERRRADGVLRSIVEPAAAEVGLQVVRADQIAKGGQVNLQIIEHICKASNAVADLTGGNLNVYYEVGMRHAVRKPLALMADESESLPFDLLQQRTIFFANDLEGAASCRDSLRDQLRGSQDGAVDSPVDAALNVGVLAQGDETQRALADLVQKVDALTSDVHTRMRGQRSPSPTAIADVLDAWYRLTARAEEREDEELADVARRLTKPTRYLARRYLDGKYTRSDSPRHREALDRLFNDRPMEAAESETEEHSSDSANGSPRDDE
jgi:hypothetical protein